MQGKALAFACADAALKKSVSLPDETRPWQPRCSHQPAHFERHKLPLTQLERGSSAPVPLDSLSTDGSTSRPKVTFFLQGIKGSIPLSGWSDLTAMNQEDGEDEGLRAQLLQPTSPFPLGWTQHSGDPRGAAEGRDGSRDTRTVLQLGTERDEEAAPQGERLCHISASLSLGFPSCPQSSAHVRTPTHCQRCPGGEGTEHTSMEQAGKRADTAVQQLLSAQAKAQLTALSGTAGAWLGQKGGCRKPWQGWMWGPGCPTAAGAPGGLSHSRKAPS